MFSWVGASACVTQGFRLHMWGPGTAEASHPPLGSSSTPLPAGTLHPNCQDSSGRPRRDIGTILQILNDLLSATRHYQGMPPSLTQLRCHAQCAPDLAPKTTSCEKLAAAAPASLSQARLCKPPGECPPPPHPVLGLSRPLCAPLRAAELLVAGRGPPAATRPALQAGVEKGACVLGAHSIFVPSPGGESILTSSSPPSGTFSRWCVGPL